MKIYKHSCATGINEVDISLNKLVNFMKMHELVFFKKY
jgi:hypothetical protein